ncbi:damage-inducible protein DinB [Cytobacillus firmus]|uniref:DinB family protein n=1 Tax=Cytobacillus firmus TaxID=1399 RepID=UPI0018CED410|nr:DinB family protein [Cytobacillus firmus]MBG9447408.1 damage-inducible protein DinB [Cytobacillus firmus]MBG9451224.1 damage-inducible protein DinB [Cytobacillus firmus]
MENNRAEKMYDYHVWANQKLIQHLKQLPDRIYNETVNSVFSSISEVLIHLYATDITWLETMKGSSFHDTVREVERRKTEASRASIDELKVFYDSLSNEFYHFFADNQDPERIIITEHPKYGRCEFILSDLIHHVVNHGTYHRGNVTAMLHQQGERGVPTDYVYFLFEC